MKQRGAWPPGSAHSAGAQEPSSSQLARSGYGPIWSFGIPRPPDRRPQLSAPQARPRHFRIQDMGPGRRRRGLSRVCAAARGWGLREPSVT